MTLSSAAGGGRAWEQVGLLSEPTRRLVYDAVRDAAEPPTRDEVAAAVGIDRRLAAFHLERLVAAGLCSSTPGRRLGGRGAGRPPKRYRAVDAEVSLSVPPRRYDLVARILARAVASAPEASAAEALAVAAAEGERVGLEQRPRGRAGAGAVCQALAVLGYEPVRDGRRAVRLRNCPFHAAVDCAPQLVCGVNRELIAGVLDGLGVGDRWTAELTGRGPDCCVTVTSA